jgi:hypothetical protein
MLWTRTLPPPFSTLPPYPHHQSHRILLTLAFRLVPPAACNMSSRPPRDPGRSKDRPATPVAVSRSPGLVTVPVPAPIDIKVCCVLPSSCENLPVIGRLLYPVLAALGRTRTSMTFVSPRSMPPPPRRYKPASTVASLTASFRPWNPALSTVPRLIVCLRSPRTASTPLAPASYSSLTDMLLLPLIVNALPSISRRVTSAPLLRPTSRGIPRPTSALVTLPLPLARSRATLVSQASRPLRRRPDHCSLAQISLPRCVEKRTLAIAGSVPPRLATGGRVLSMWKRPRHRSPRHSRRRNPWSFYLLVASQSTTPSTSHHRRRTSYRRLIPLQPPLCRSWASM